MPSITSNTSFVINGIPRALSGGFYLNGVKILESATNFVYSYNGTAYTDSNGERFLEDSLNTQDIKLVSGRGLEFNGVDQTFNLGTMTVGNNSTFIFTVEKIPDVDLSDGYLISSDYNYVIAINSDGTVRIRWQYETQIVTFSNIVVDLSRPITLAIVFGNDGEGIHTCMYEDQVGYAQASTVVNFSITNMYLASRGNVNRFSQAIFRSAINLPEYSFTQQDLAAHLQNPERTVYLENGTLKSDILPQATLDSMAAGNGFAYLMTENENSNGNLTNICTNTTSAIENWSSTMHTNVADHSHGIQTALLDQDANGVPTGIATIDVQAADFADAQTQFSNENGLSLTDNEGILELRVSYLSEITTQDGQVIQTEDGQTLEV
jgi:hypothetical protein